MADVRGGEGGEGGFCRAAAPDVHGRECGALCGTRSYSARVPGVCAEWLVGLRGRGETSQHDTKTCALVLAGCDRGGGGMSRERPGLGRHRDCLASRDRVDASVASAGRRAGCGAGAPAHLSARDPGRVHRLRSAYASPRIRGRGGRRDAVPEVRLHPAGNQRAKVSGMRRADLTGGLARSGRPSMFSGSQPSGWAVPTLRA